MFFLRTEKGVMNYTENFPRVYPNIGSKEILKPFYHENDLSIYKQEWSWSCQSNRHDSFYTDGIKSSSVV